MAWQGRETEGHTSENEGHSQYINNWERRDSFFLLKKNSLFVYVEGMRLNLISLLKQTP